jgi:hypothetical protein
VVRFLSLDPWAADYVNWSPYNYVFSNPVSLVDPTGRGPWNPISGIGGGIASQFESSLNVLMDDIVDLSEAAVANAKSVMTAVGDFLERAENLKGNATASFGIVETGGGEYQGSNGQIEAASDAKLLFMPSEYREAVSTVATKGSGGNQTDVNATATRNTGKTGGGGAGQALQKTGGYSTNTKPKVGNVNAQTNKAQVNNAANSVDKPLGVDSVVAVPGSNEESWKTYFDDGSTNVYQAGE